MDDLKQFLVLLALGGAGGLVLAWGNNRLFMPREGAESMRTLAYVFFLVLGLALAGVVGIEQAYKGLFDDVAERIRPVVHEGLVTVGLDPASVPVGEVGRVFEEMDKALQREIQRKDAGWFVELLEPWGFSKHLGNGRVLAQALRDVDTIHVDRALLLARDASFGYLFPWTGPATWALLLLFPFFAWLWRVSAR